jgi:DNA-binding LytR/AlgR family response regulator
VSRKELEAVLIDINEAYHKKLDLGQPEIISIKIGGNIFQLPKDKIIYLEQYGNKCIIHTTTKTVYCYQSLEAISERLANDAFIRCHKSYIVNRNYVEQTDLAGMSITLTNGQHCFIGGKYKKDLVKKLAQ